METDANTKQGRAPDCAVSEPFFSAKLRLEYWLYFKKLHRWESNNGLWTNNFTVNTAHQIVQISERKQEKVPLLGSRYGKKLSIDNFQPANSVSFDIFSEKHILCCIP